MNYKLEVIAFNSESCSIAQNNNAHRVELCDNPGDGGTTPSYGFIKAARRKLSVELYPIIRPRGGDFLYSDDEFGIMKDEVILCKKLGCDGIVTGILKADGTVDKERCLKLVELAYPMGVSFHRAFDRTIDAFSAMEAIVETGFERILTSGQRATAVEGIDLISKLIEKAGERIIIMPGSGLRAENVKMIAVQTKATEFHTSARTMTDSKMQFRNKKINEELNSLIADADEITKIAAILETLSD